MKNYKIPQKIIYQNRKDKIRSYNIDNEYNKKFPRIDFTLKKDNIIITGLYNKLHNID